MNTIFLIRKIKEMGRFVARHGLVFSAFVFFILFSFAVSVFATPPTTQYGAAETLNPTCAPGSTNCSVSTGSGWGLTGNAGTVAGTNFIGTTDAVDFVIKRNNVELLRLSSTNIGIGTNNPRARLDLKNSADAGGVVLGSNFDQSVNRLWLYNDNANSFIRGFSYGAYLRLSGDTAGGGGNIYLYGSSANSSTVINPSIGNVGIGTSATPSTKLHIIATTEQLRLGYDVSNYFSTTVGSTGSTTFALTGTTPTFSFSNAISAPSYNGVGVTIGSVPYSVFVDSGYTTNVTGSGRNTVLGAIAGATNISGAYNTFIGFGAGNTTTTSYNTYIGAGAGFSNTAGENNTFVGYAVGYANGIGANNAFVGGGGANTDGSGNSFLGAYSGNNVTIGSQNTIIGYNTGLGITTGNYNTIIGAGVNSLSTSLANTVIIADGQGNKRIYVNSTGQVGLNCVDPDHVLEVGGTGSGCNTGAGSYLNAAGDTTFTANSSRVWKDNITTVEKENILDLIASTPVRRYDWKPEYCDGSQCLNKIGFIAEEFYPVLEHGDNQHVNGQDVSMAEWLGLQKLIQVTSTMDLRIQNLNSLDVNTSGTFGYMVKTLLADTANTITDMYAKIVHADRVETNELCVGTTCITEAQFLQMVNQNSSNVTPVPPTPDPIPTPDPAPTPDPVPSNEPVNITPNTEPAPTI